MPAGEFDYFDKVMVSAQMNNSNQPPKTEGPIIYEGGAVRSERKPRYQDLESEFLTRTAKAFSKGYLPYEKGKLPPGQKNWKKGDLEFALDALDHAFEHLLLYMRKVRATTAGELPENLPEKLTQEDHLGHLGANLVMLAEFEAAGFFEPPRAGDEEYGAPDDTPPWEPAPEPKESLIQRAVSVLTGKR